MERHNLGILHKHSSCSSVLHNGLDITKWFSAAESESQHTAGHMTGAALDANKRHRKSVSRLKRN